MAVRSVSRGLCNAYFPEVPVKGFSNAVIQQVVNALMRHRWSRMVLSLIALLAAAGSGLSLMSQAGHADAQDTADGTEYTLAGKVVRVADGDTFTLLVKGKQHRVRMASIDAPEQYKDSRQPGQPTAAASRQALSDLIAGKTLTLQCYEKDRFDRNICLVPLSDGRIANRVMVQSGMAWANMEGRGKFMRDPELPAMEQQARRARLGLWSSGAPVAPWVWRYQCWTQQQCQGAG
jgi:micrococcal nuclease